jgi:hypothetical protein
VECFIYTFSSFWNTVRLTSRSGAPITCLNSPVFVVDLLLTVPRQRLSVFLYVYVFLLLHVLCGDTSALPLCPILFIHQQSILRSLYLFHPPLPILCLSPSTIIPCALSYIFLFGDLLGALPLRLSGLRSVKVALPC